MPEIIDEFEEKYQIIRSEIEGELSGKTFLLFSEILIDKLAEVCLHSDISLKLESNQPKKALLLTISQIITQALVDELHQLLQVKLRVHPSEALFNNEQLLISCILRDLPAHQPFVIAIKTQFKRVINLIKLPLIIVLHAHLISKLLHILRQDNLYNFKLLQADE